MGRHLGSTKVSVSLGGGYCFVSSRRVYNVVRQLLNGHNGGSAGGPATHKYPPSIRSMLALLRADRVKRVPSSQEGRLAT